MLVPTEDDELGGDQRAWDIYGAWTRLVNRDATEAEYRTLRRMARLPHSTDQIVAFVPYAWRRGHQDLDGIADELARELVLGGPSQPEPPPTAAEPAVTPRRMRPVPPEVYGSHGERFEQVRELIREFGRLGGTTVDLMHLSDEEFARWVELRRAGQQPVIHQGRVLDAAAIRGRSTDQAEPNGQEQPEVPPETEETRSREWIDPDDVPFV